jgi:hypothetical protein
MRIEDTRLSLPMALYKIIERHDEGHDGEVLAFIIPHDTAVIDKSRLRARHRNSLQQRLPRISAGSSIK